MQFNTLVMQEATNCSASLLASCPGAYLCRKCAELSMFLTYNAHHRISNSSP